MFNNKRQSSNSKKEYAPDAGNLSLWVNHSGKGTHAASGIVTITVDPETLDTTVDKDGKTVIQLRVFMYEPPNKKSEHSPDYFGFLKVQEPREEEEEAPPKSKRTNKRPAKSGNEW